MLNPEKLCPGCMNESSEQICSFCGHDRAVNNGKDELPISFRLSDRFVVGKAVARSSEGITYIAWDNSTDTAVNIKEYFPSEVSVRNPDKTVSMAQGKEFAFNEGLMEFMEINRALIDSELPSLIPVLSVFEENGTAYVAKTVFSGITLKSFLERNGGSLKWEQARPLFLPLLDTVKGLNALGIIHAGISPETILVGRDGKLRLSEISISAVRCSGGDIPEILYDGYAAAEQYGFENLNIGNYTDVYGLSATLFRVLIGAVPPNAQERMTNDGLTIPARFADELPRQVLVSLANGLQVMPKNRSNSVETFKNELVYGETQENARRAASKKAAEQASKADKAVNKKKKSSGAKYAVISALCTALLFAAVAGILCVTVFKDDIFGTGSSKVSSDNDSIAAPSVDTIGDVDSDAVVSKQLYNVPDLSGEFYSRIIDNEEYERFEFSIKGMEFSDKHPKGAVCAQSVAAGTAVEKDTKIELTISLGYKEIKVANVMGLDEENAKIELLKQGFLYDNIEIVPKYDSEAKPGVVLDQDPAYGTKVSPQTAVRVYVNSYKGDEESVSSDLR